MNHIFSNVSLVPQFFSSAFESAVNLLPTLSTRQKQILIISSIAIGIIAAMVMIYNCCFTGNTNYGGGYSPASPPAPGPYGGSSVSPPFGQKQPSPQPMPMPMPTYTNTGYGTGITNPYIAPQPSGVSPSAGPKQGVFAIEDEINLLQEELYDERQLIALGAVHMPQSMRTKKTSEVKKDDASTDLNKDDQAVVLTDPVPVDSAQTDPATTNSVPTDPATTADPAITDPAATNSVPTDPTSEDDLSAVLKEIEEEGMTARELNIVELEEKLNKALKKYPQSLSAYLVDKYSGFQQKNTQEVYERLVRLSGYLQTHADNHSFVHASLQEIDQFLTRVFFTSQDELCLQEQQKVDLIIFHELFAMVEASLDILEKRDRRLAINLKLKIANLPLHDDLDRKKKFPKAYLSEQDQVDVLSHHFQSEEDRFIATVIQNFQTRTFNEKDVKKLAKMVTKGKSCLSDANRTKLQAAISQRMGHHAHIQWNDFDKVHQAMKQTFNIASSGWGYNNYGQVNSAEILNMHRASKAKEFFESQIGLSNDRIQIPRWYHATKHYPNSFPAQNYVLDIIKEGQIRVEHRQAFKGSWVSTRRESDFGNSVFVFTHRIARLDPNVFIGFEHGKVRWRGLQAPIPLVDPTTQLSNVCLVGVYKGIDKTNKLAVVNALIGKGIKKPVVVSVDQVDYIQREIIKVMGNPNLTEKWWGRADFSHLDRLPAQQHIV